MALPLSGKTYRFENLGASGRYLNLYSTGTASNGMNVVLWTGDTSNEQKWKFDGTRLRPLTNTNFSLDRYDVDGNANHNNADIWSATTADYPNQQIQFVAVSNTVSRIKLSQKNLYLTAASNANGTTAGKTPTSAGNLYWAALGSSTYQQWTFEEVADSGGTVTPGVEVEVTEMPSGGGYTGNIEYFHPGSGMKSGTFLGTNNGQDILNKITSFYKKAFKMDPPTGAVGYARYAHSLFGSKTIMEGTKFDKTYHCGVDMVAQRSDGSRDISVYTVHSGELIYAKDNRIALYDSAKDVTYLYLHTKIDAAFAAQMNKMIPIGTKIGEQSAVGLGTGGRIHLHFEVNKGRNSTEGNPNKNLNIKLPSISPYKYM